MTCYSDFANRSSFGGHRRKTKMCQGSGYEYMSLNETPARKSIITAEDIARGAQYKESRNRGRSQGNVTSSQLSHALYITISEGATDLFSQSSKYEFDVNGELVPSGSHRSTEISPSLRVKILSNKLVCPASSTPISKIVSTVPSQKRNLSTMLYGYSGVAPFQGSNKRGSYTAVCYGGGSSFRHDDGYGVNTLNNFWRSSRREPMNMLRRPIPDRRLSTPEEAK